jgi:RHS repeat-associated protein
MDATTYGVTKRYTTPFGAPRGEKAANWPDDKAFLGKPADEGTGLTHVGAREYDPGIGQFISVDPLLETDKPQTLNGYSYAANSPVTHSDPTGLRLACGGAGGAQEACPTRPDGTQGNGRLNEAVDYTKSGTSRTDNFGHTGTTGSTAPADYRCGFPGCSAGMLGYGPNVDKYVNAGLPYRPPVPDAFDWAADRLGLGDEWDSCDSGNSLLGCGAYALAVFLKVRGADDGSDSPDGSDGKRKRGKGGERDGDDDFISIYKAPQRGQGEFQEKFGYLAKNFPNTKGNPYENGFVYFAKERKLAESYARSYGEGVMEVRIPTVDYRDEFEQYEKPYQGGPLTELEIPNTVVEDLNKYWRELRK